MPLGEVAGIWSGYSASSAMPFGRTPEPFWSSAKTGKGGKNLAQQENQGRH
jgi:hypothetical protein